MLIAPDAEELLAVFPSLSEMQASKVAEAFSALLDSDFPFTPDGAPGMIAITVLDAFKNNVEFPAEPNQLAVLVPHLLSVAGKLVVHASSSYADRKQMSVRAQDGILDLLCRATGAATPADLYLLLSRIGYKTNIDAFVEIVRQYKKA